MSSAQEQPFRFEAEEEDGRDHEEISQNMWAILVTLAAQNGGRIDLTPKQLQATEGLQARMHLDEDGGATICVNNMPASRALPAATHASTMTLQ
jgi:hypothetical protein